MDDNNEARVALRRATYALRDSVQKLGARAQAINPEAERAIQLADRALFQAWTQLCEHSLDDDDHDH